jgi:transcriptional regulator with XRE-family HTH domain
VQIPKFVHRVSDNHGWARRGARGILGWNQADLAKAAGVTVLIVQQFEAGTGKPRRATVAVIRQLLESAGIEFIDENGGRASLLRATMIQIAALLDSIFAQSALATDFLNTGCRTRFTHTGHATLT